IAIGTPSLSLAADASFWKNSDWGSVLAISACSMSAKACPRTDSVRRKKISANVIATKIEFFIISPHSKLAPRPSLLSLGMASFCAVSVRLGVSHYTANQSNACAKPDQCLEGLKMYRSGSSHRLQLGFGRMVSKNA